MVRHAVALFLTLSNPLSRLAPAQETQTVNLNKVHYEVLEQAATDGETASSSEDEEAGGATQFEDGDQDPKAVVAGTSLSNGHAKVKAHHSS